MADRVSAEPVGLAPATPAAGRDAATVGTGSVTAAAGQGSGSAGTSQLHLCIPLQMILDVWWEPGVSVDPEAKGKGKAGKGKGKAKLKGKGKGKLKRKLWSDMPIPPSSDPANEECRGGGFVDGWYDALCMVDEQMNEDGRDDDVECDTPPN